jgi:putative membrane protein
MNWIIQLLLSGLSLWVVDWMLDSVTLQGFGTALVAAFILGLMNLVVRPILIFLTLPATVLSLGLFLFVVNALTYWLASMIVPGFEVTGFWGAFLGAIVTTIVTTVVQSIYGTIVRK